MRGYLNRIVVRPKLGLAIVFAGTVALAAQIPKLQVNTSPSMLMLENDPAADFYDQSIERFGTDNVTAILVKSDDIFSFTALSTIERLSDGALQLDEVQRVDSLTTVNDISGTDDSLSTDSLIPGGVVDDDAAIAHTRVQALRNPTIMGSLVSPDTRASTILIYAEPDEGDVAFDLRFTAALEGLIVAERERTGLEIYQLGKPYIESTLARVFLSDQATILPFSAAILIAVLLITFRSVPGVLIPVLARVVSVVWAMGWLGLLGYPVTLLTVLIPTLLVCIGFTEDVHFISEYNERCAAGLDREAAIAATAMTLGAPLLVTSITTSVGFASFSFSDITVLKEFGRIAPLAFASSFLVTILLVPACLRYAPRPERRSDPSSEDSRASMFDRLLTWIGDLVSNQPRLIMSLALVIAVVGLAGIPRIRTDNDFKMLFKQDSEVRRRLADIHESIAGGSMLYVVIDAHEEGRASKADVIKHTASLQAHIDETGKADVTVSAADYIKLMNRELNGGSDDYFTVPDSDALIAQYLVMLHPDDLEKYLAYDHSATNIVVRHDIHGPGSIDAFVADILAYAERSFPQTISVGVTSESLLTARAGDYMSANLATGLGYTIAIVAVVCSLFFMSLKAGALSLIPNLLPAAFGFGVMGLLDIPLNVGTAMVAAVAVGIAVDDTVHYMARNSHELDRHHDQFVAMRATLAAEGRAIIATTIALSGGLGILAYSSVLPQAYFGALAAVVMIAALVCDLTITPALMASTRLVTLWNAVGFRLRGDITEIAPLFSGLSQWEARKVVLLGQLTSLTSGDYAVRRGSTDNDYMYMVLTGYVEVVVPEHGRDHVLARFGPGELFGEMALVDSRERSADVVAGTDSELLALGSADLDRIRKRFPRTAAKLFQNLAAILSGRVRNTTTTMTSMMAERSDG